MNYHDDFDTDAVQNAGLHMAVAQTVVEGNIMAAAADSAFVIGKQAGNILKDLKDETIDAKDALKAGGQVLRLQGGKSVVKIGGATLRSTEQYLSSFQVSTDDFTGSVPGKVKEAATNTGNILKKITNVVLHPLRNLIAMGKVILIGAVILLFLIIVSLLGQMSGTTSTSVFGANRIEDIQTLVQKINDYRNAAVTEGIYQAFQNDVDPNGNPYGYDSLTGQRSNNLQHGVTWNYANGIYNDTAEIISLAAVYYQQDWPRSELVSAFGDNVPFTKFCRALAAYGLDVTARESAPYSCMSYGLAAVEPNVLSGKYAFLSACVVGDAENRYQFSCEQNELSTETGADFHLTVTDTASPDREMNTSSRDQNSTVQAANSFNNRDTAAPEHPAIESEVVSQPVKQQEKQLDLLSLLLDFMPVMLVGAVLFAVRRKRRH